MRKWYAILVVGIVACSFVCGCGDKEEKVPAVTAKQLENLKKMSEAATTTAEPTSTALQSIAHCSIAIAYIKSAKNRFASKNPDFDRHAPLTVAQIDPFMADGRTFAGLECPKGGKYSVNTLAKEASCSKCTQ